MKVTTNNPMTTTCKVYVMLFLCCYLGLFNSQWISVENPNVPKSDHCMAIGYYNNTNTITMLGGYMGYGFTKDIIQYHINNSSFDIQRNALSESSEGHSQYYTQIINILYMIERNGAYVNTYNLLTKQFTKNTFNQTIPIGVGITGCLASTNDELYVIGGSNRNDLQIFSLSISSWSEGPNMQQIREYHSCIVVPNMNTLYAIGGILDKGLTSIEFISLTDIEHNLWNYTDQELSESVGYSRAVLYHMLIYVIGGKSGDYSQFPDDVYIIDTNDNTVSISPHKLAYGGSSPSTIVIHNLLYSFGGRVLNRDPGSTNQWQYYRLPTQDPTALPSKEPTGEPSNAPTKAPHTLSPISQPTLQPISQSTSQPSDAPTKASSTLQPLSQPTLQPFDAPTNTPKPILIAYSPLDVTLQPVQDPTCSPNAATAGRMTTSQLRYLDASSNTDYMAVIVGGILSTIIITAILAHVFVQKRSNTLRDQQTIEQTIEPVPGLQSGIQMIQDTIETKTQNNSNNNTNNNTNIWDDEESVTFSVDNKGTTTGGMVIKYKLPQENITKRGFM